MAVAGSTKGRSGKLTNIRLALIGEPAGRLVRQSDIHVAPLDDWSYCFWAAHLQGCFVLVGGFTGF
jgi:hypothetical protein